MNSFLLILLVVVAVDCALNAKDIAREKIIAQQTVASYLFTKGRLTELVDGLFVDRATLSVEHFPKLHGKREIVKFLGQERKLRGVTEIAMKSTSTDLLGKSYAIDHGTYRIVRKHRNYDETGTYTQLWKKSDDHWKLVHASKQMKH